MPKFKIVLPLLFIIALAGLGLWIYQYQEGLIVTNMRNSFSWGLYIAMWAFFVGAAAGGLVVTSAVYLFKVQRLKPFARIASMTAFICTIAAMGMLIPDLGRLDRIYNVLLHPNFSSVLPWDFIVLSAYAALAAVYTYVQMRPDIAAHGIRLPLFGVIGKKEISVQELEHIQEKSERQAKLIAPVALILAILIHTVTAWVLATQLSRPWWFGGALAPAFIASAIASGPAVVILAALYTLRRKEGLALAYASLAKIAVFGGIILLFIYYNDFVVKLWWGAGQEYESVRVMFLHYWPIHLVEILFIIAAIVLFLKWARGMIGLIAGSLCMCLGILAHRFLLIPPAYNVIPLKVPAASDGGLVEWVYPIALGEVQGTVDDPSPIFVSWWNYIPSPVEFAITAGIVAAVVLVYLGLSKVLPLTEVNR